MFEKRIKIFIALSFLFLVICIIRLGRIQLSPDSSIQDKIAELKLQMGKSIPLKTLRGKILDRKGRILATDEPRFELNISYDIASFLDERIIKAKMLLAEGADDPVAAREKLTEEINHKNEVLQQIIEKCEHFGLTRAELGNKIENINNMIYIRRLSLAWRHNCSKFEFYQQNKNNLLSVRASDIIEDFEKYCPDEEQRLILIERADIVEMHRNRPLFDLNTDDDVFTAQFEFMNIDGVTIEPRAQRVYPYGCVAAQTIGWISPAMERDVELFEDDKFLMYLDGELSGRSGVEYVCETTLRGRRGEIFYDIDGNEHTTETEFGKDVQLTLDIELQKKIEDFLINYQYDPNCKPGKAAVVIDVVSGDIIALASIPTFDLNRIRTDYDRIVSDPNHSLINRTIYQAYPPGSSVKPIILIAGLETNAITPNTPISCPAHKPEEGWPQCWINRQYPYLGHDMQFEYEGGNIARNAVRGSCNIYFSRLADRIETEKLQLWLYNFGYGRRILFPPPSLSDPNTQRNFLQAQGSISSSRAEQIIQSPNDLPPLKSSEKRYFGIGQGNLWATPLQATNAIAAIARKGIFQMPRLFIEETQPEITNLNLAASTINTIYDGMRAVIYEVNGTAYTAFRDSDFSSKDVTIYGKTGSTESPDNAWFAGFAKDSTGRAIAVAVVVEGGQHGSSDAAPLAGQIINFCIDSGYLGNIPAE